MKRLLISITILVAILAMSCLVSVSPLHVQAAQPVVSTGVPIGAPIAVTGVPVSAQGTTQAPTVTLLLPSLPAPTPVPGTCRSGVYQPYPPCPAMPLYMPLYQPRYQ